MDTIEVASKLGTTPRQLRQFLRSPYSTFIAVGSGSRYEFTESDLITLTKRFSEWKAGGRSKSARSATRTTPRMTSTPAAPSAVSHRDKKDRAVWKEEGPVKLEDIRDRRVRARVLADAKAAEDRLMMLLISRGMHITQLGDRRAS